MLSFDLNSLTSTPSDSGRPNSVVDFSGKSLKLDTANDRVRYFLNWPTVENLNKLGENAADVIDVYLKVITNPTDLIQAYVDAIFCVANLSEQCTKAGEIAEQMYPLLINHARQQHESSWVLANAMLAALGLIKSDQVIRWRFFPWYTSLSRVINAQYFPIALRKKILSYVSLRA